MISHSSYILGDFLQLLNKVIHSRMKNYKNLPNFFFEFHHKFSSLLAVNFHAKDIINDTFQTIIIKSTFLNNKFSVRCNREKGEFGGNHGIPAICNNPERNGFHHWVRKKIVYKVSHNFSQFLSVFFDDFWVLGDLP